MSRLNPRLDARRRSPDSERLPLPNLLSAGLQPGSRVPSSSCWQLGRDRRCGVGQGCGAKKLPTSEPMTSSIWEPEGASASLVISLLGFLDFWLTDHIKSSDQGIADHSRTHAPEMVR
jgi:hypothetical protein